MVKVQVKLGATELKLTLTPKFLAKSLQDAVLNPFLGAYNKRTGASLTTAGLLKIEVDGAEVSALASETAGFPADIFTGELHHVVLTAPTPPDAGPPPPEVERVLGAAHEFAVLGLPLDVASQASVRRAYRKVSLAVHPDKAGHPRAGEAFRKAFDAMKLLLDERRQAARLRRIRAGDAADGEAGEGGSLPAEYRWWEGATVSEMEQSFRNLEEFLEAQGYGEDQVEDNLWVDADEAERLRAGGLAFFVDSRDAAAYAASHVAGALSIPGHTMEELQNLAAHPGVLQLARSPAAIVVVYSDNGSKLSRCVHVSSILRQTVQPERVRRLRGGLNGWKRVGLPVDGDARQMFAGQVAGGRSLTGDMGGMSLGP